MSPYFIDWKISSADIESFIAIDNRPIFIFNRKKKKREREFKKEAVNRNAKRERFVIDYTMIYHVLRSTDYFDYVQMNEVNEMMCGRYETRCFDINKWRQASATRSTAITVDNFCSPRDNKGSSILIYLEIERSLSSVRFGFTRRLDGTFAPWPVSISAIRRGVTWMILEKFNTMNNREKISTRSIVKLNVDGLDPCLQPRCVEKGRTMNSVLSSKARPASLFIERAWSHERSLFNFL